MDNILEQIVDHKRREVAARKKAQPLERLQASGYFAQPTRSFTGSIMDPGKPGLIAEFKRRSPSEGLLNAEADVQSVTSGYAAQGASALSILTDEDFFGGGSYDLSMTRRNSAIPILRKDFIIDEYQVFEARAMGADAILLIASILSPRAVSRLARLAREQQLEVLLEVHDLEELDCLCPEINAVGVNNRDLKTFTTDLQRSIDLYPYLPEELVKISESGIRTAADIRRLKQAGFNGFLVGSLFMREASPHHAFGSFVQTLDHEN